MHEINYPSFSYPFFLKQSLSILTNIRMSIRITRQAARISGQTPSESQSIEPSPSKQVQEKKQSPKQPQQPPPPPPPPAPLDPLEISLYRREQQVRQAILYKTAHLDLGLDWISYQQQLLDDLENPRPIGQNGEAMQRDKQPAEQRDKRMDEDGGQKGNSQEINEIAAEKPKKKKVHKVRTAHPSLQVYQTLVESETLQVQSPPPRSSNGGVYIKDIAVQVNLERPPPLKVLDIDYDENGQEVVRVSYRSRQFLCSREYMEQRHMRALIDYYEELMYAQHVIPKQKKKKKKEKQKEEKEKEKATTEEVAKTGQDKGDKDPKANFPADKKKPPEKERQKQQKLPELQQRRRSSRLEQSESRSKDKKKNKH